MPKKQVIAELKPGASVNSYFSVGYKKPLTEYKYGWMFEFRIADRSGQMTSKYWGGQDRDFVQQIHDSFQREDVVQIHGEVADYRGSLEISISEKNGGSITKLGPSDYDLNELIRSYDNVQEMREEFMALMDSVRDASLRRVLDDFFGDEAFMAAFSSSPASIQMHSAAVGGLLRHTLNVAKISMRVAELHPDLDRDLILAGALLHDIGKVQSFKVTSNITQTEQGNLIGHIILGDQALMEKISRIKGFPSDRASKLRHTLLAHHGRKEWGSPVEPMLPEALVVHEADDLDAKIDYMTTKKKDAVTEDDWIWDSRLQRLIYLR